MQLQITFRDFQPSPTLRARIEARSQKLVEFHERILHCRVIVRAPHHRSRKGRLYALSIELKVPGRAIAINRNPTADHAHEDPYVAVRDAFDAVERRLEDIARRQRGDTKTHMDEPHGRIARLFPKEGYGFIDADNGDEVYFHRNSVTRRGFAALEVGTAVRFSAEAGDKGLQATFVKPVGRRSRTGVKSRTAAKP